MICDLDRCHLLCPCVLSPDVTSVVFQVTIHCVCKHNISIKNGFHFHKTALTTSPSKHVHNIYTMLDQRRRRWPTLYKCCTYILCSLGDVINVAETELKTEWLPDVLFIV